MNSFAKCLLVGCLFVGPVSADEPTPRPAAAGRMMMQLRSKDWILRADALEYLARHKVEEARAPIRALAEDNSAKAWLRGRALVALTRLEADGATSLIVRFASDKNPPLRAASAEAIQYSTAKQLETPLQKLLDDADPLVRSRALASFAKRRGAESWAVVDPRTKDLSPTSVRWGSRALALVGNDEAFARLTKLAEKPDLQTDLLRGIQGVRDPKLIAVVLRILTNSEPEGNRFSAGLAALQQFEEAAVLKELSAKLESGGADLVRTASAIAVRMLRAPELGDALRKAVGRLDDKKTLEIVMMALARDSMKPGRHRTLFIDNLDHEDTGIRELAIRGLAHCRNVNLYEQLRARLADKEPTVVEAALGALQRAPTLDAPKGKLVEYLKAPLASPEPTVRRLAFELLAHAGTAADFQSAMTLLKDQLTGSDDAIRSEIAKVLGSIASDEQFGSIVRRQGFIAKWHVLGTFPSDRQHKGFATEYPPEKEIDFTAKYKAKYAWVLRGNQQKKADLEREIKWIEATVDQTDGRLMMAPLVPPPGVQVVAYAVADVRAGQTRKVYLTIDGDDGFRVILNGKKLTEKLAAPYKHNQPNVVEQTRIEIELRAGPNRFVVKSANIDGSWWLRLRLTDKDGRPVALLQ